MDETRYRLRRYRDEDVPAEVRIDARATPSFAVTEEQVRFFTRMLTTPPNFQIKLVAEEAGGDGVVAIGAVGTVPDEFDPTCLYGGISVDPDHQRRGIGQALAAALLDHARARAARKLVSGAREADERGIEFLLHQGFRERRRRWRSRLTLSEAHELPDRSSTLARSGITFTTLAAEGPGDPEVRRRIVEMSLDASQDIPRSGPYSPETLRTFLQLELEGPTLLPEAYFLAVRDGEYVGASFVTLAPALPGELHQNFTGTRRAARRLGIASELKRRVAEYARLHGYRAIVTSNDSLNRAMWAINERQGFRREEVWVEMERDIRSNGTV